MGALPQRSNGEIHEGQRKIKLKLDGDGPKASVISSGPKMLQKVRSKDKAEQLDRSPDEVQKVTRPKAQGNCPNKGKTATCPQPRLGA